MKKYHGAFIKNEREVACLREANRMVANILDAVGDMVAPGLPTMRLEELARDMCAGYKVKPAFLGYCGYPYAIWLLGERAGCARFPLRAAASGGGYRQYRHGRGV